MSIVTMPGLYLLYYIYLYQLLLGSQKVSNIGVVEKKTILYSNNYGRTDMH